MEKVEFVVVGAGLSGLATAMVLAEAGAEVLVVERGDYPGSKNVTGGRLYLAPVRPYLSDLWESAPFERQVVKERLTMMAPHSSTTLELNSQRFKETSHSSFTLLHATFDRWFADQAAERGALVIPGYKVDDLMIKDGVVCGIVSSGDSIQADAVVAADGVLSFMAQKAGMRAKLEPDHSAVAAKEVIELNSETINERFGVGEDEGATHLFFGSITEGVPGGGFIYTNKGSLSIGLVLTLQHLMETSSVEENVNSNSPSPHDMLEAFKVRPEIQPLIDGGHSVEYSAHVIPEGGFQSLSRLVTDGMVVVGDAAGFTMNMGVTVRGLDFALASGVMAGRALLRARETQDFSSASLSYYETMLKESFVWQDLKTFQHMPEFLANLRLYELYPELVSDLFEQILMVGTQPKEKLSKTVLRTMREKLRRVEVLKDLWAFRKI